MKSRKLNRHFFRLSLVVLGVMFGDHIAAAQTCDVTWRKIDNPHIISGTVTIPANQRVCIEPGVIVQWANGAKIDLNGSIVGLGTSAERITFDHSNGANGIEVIGTLDLRFADVNVISNINAGGSLYCRNCNFGELGEIIDTSINIDSLPTRFVQIEDSVFDSNAATQGENAQLFAAGLTAVLRNVAFRNGAFCILGDSYIYFENVTADNSLITGMAFNQAEFQPLYLNNLSIRNSAGAGLALGHGNFEIGPNVILQNNEYPVSGKGGLMPGSNVPATGNRNNWFEVGQPNSTDSMYPQIAVPYVIDSFSDIGSLQILPGARFKARSNFHFNTESGPVHILGLPEAPITFEPFTPEQKWDGGQFNSNGDRMEYVTMDGSQRGVVDANSANGILYIDNSILRNNGTAISTPTAFLQGNLFANNTTAINSTRIPSVRASGRTNPNLFENNTTAVQAASGSLPDVRYNWWNSPTGPQSAQNPGGTGDSILGTAYFQPFRTARPDTTDHPPVVRVPHIPFPRSAHRGMIEAGSKVILNWKASDDGQIVKQRILYSPAGNARGSFHIIADNLPPTQREYELVVPTTGFEVSGLQAYVRVVAFDNKGQEGWDEWQAMTPADQEPGVLQITSNVAGQTFIGGQRTMPLTWIVTTPFQNTDFVGYIVLDADRQLIDVGGGQNGQTFLRPRMPQVSTDSARFAVRVAGTTNRQKWFFSPPFSIRPDPRYIDAPPQISMTSPAASQEFTAGSIVPISWTAFDDEALRQFNIQVSTDGGRTWIPIAENLPPATTNYNWQTPFGGGANDVRIRVIAIDRRFQNSSDGGTRVFRLTSPPNAAPSIQLTFPANGATYAVGQALFVAADASDSDGTIRRVEFYETTSQFGPLTTKFIGADANPPYQIGWTYPNAQTHTITARVVDDRNAVTTSAPVNVTVQPGSPAPLPVSLPELTNPVDGQRFDPGENITLNAFPAPSSYSTVRIEFYNGTTLIASDSTAPYEIVWNNVPAGRYTVFAKTIAGNGAEAISKPADISVGAAQIRRTPFDFDGDGKTDIGIYRPTANEWWINRSMTGQTFAVQFGAGGDVITPGDFTGDGKDDIALWRPSNGFWFILRSEDFSFYAFPFGASGDIPVPADYDGDRKADPAIFRPSSTLWFIARSSGGTDILQFGLPNDQPLPSDYDGDGKADLAIRRPTGGNSEWWISTSSGGSLALVFGADTDVGVPGDYTGDGKTDIAFWRPSTGFWFVLRSEDLSFYALPFGTSGDVPSPGDFDGDGRWDVAVFRPSDTNWYIGRTTAGTQIVPFGATGDKPIPSAFVR